MATDIASTGETFYSGTWSDVKEVLRVLNIGEGVLDKVTQPMVNHYQERVDREIDAVLSPLVHVPLRATNQVQPDGTLKRVFPGDVRHAALYWTGGLLLLSEFQNLSSNVTDQATQFIDRAQKSMYAIVRGNHRVPGQEMKSGMSRTMPPTMQPMSIPEPNF